MPPPRPPIYTLLCDVAGWTLDRTADIPKHARFAFGQRLDNLALVMERRRGLPIGNLASQWWGNFYLDEMDHWLTEAGQHRAYVRYADDFLVFSDDQVRLWELRER